MGGFRARGLGGGFGKKKPGCPKKIFFALKIQKRDQNVDNSY